MTPAAPATAPHIPKAMLRAFPVKVVDRIDRVDGEAIAAPKPWIVLPMSNCVRSAESPSITEPKTKRTIPARKIRFLPN